MAWHKPTRLERDRGTIKDQGELGKPQLSREGRRGRGVEEQNEEKQAGEPTRATNKVSVSTSDGLVVLF